MSEIIVCFVSLIYVIILLVGIIRTNIAKIILLNSLTNIIALLICFVGILKHESSYLDIAIIYFILSFISTNAYLKYFKSSDQCPKN